MTAALPRYRFVYSVETETGSIVRGNTTARNDQHVRDLLTVIHGPKAAERATVTMVAMEETGK